MSALLHTLFSRPARLGRARSGIRRKARMPGVEALESRAMLAANDIVVSLVGNRVALALDAAGTAITNLSTAYDSAAGVLTITAATAGQITTTAPIAGISVNQAADTIAVNLKMLPRFAGFAVVGGAGTDSVTIGRSGVNLGGVMRGAAAQGLSIDTGAGLDDTVTIAGPLVTRGAGALSLATQGRPMMHGILLAAGVTTPGGSQKFAGAVTLLGDVAIRAGGDVSFTSTVDGAGRLFLASGRAITLAGDVGGMQPLQGVTLVSAGRATVSRGLVLDGSGTAAGASGFLIGVNVHNVAFPASTAARAISGFSGAGIRFLGGSQGSRIAGVVSTGNGIGMQIGPGSYAGTVIAGGSFSGNATAGVSLAAARGILIGGPALGAGNSIVSNGGFGITATGTCTGSLAVGNEIGGNAVGAVENFLAGSLVGATVVQNGTGMRFQLTEVGRASFLAQRARTCTFDVTFDAFGVSARSSGRLDTRTGAVTIDAAIGYGTLPPRSPSASGQTQGVVGTNRVVDGLTPLTTLPGIEFPKSVLFVGNEAGGRHYRAVLGLSAFAGMVPLAGLGNAPVTVADDAPVTVDVWVNSQGYASRIGGTFEGGSFDVRLRGQGTTPARAVRVGTAVLAGSGARSSVASAASAFAAPALPAASNGVTGVEVGHSTLAIPYGTGYVAPADWYFPTQADGTVDVQGVIWLQHAFGATGRACANLAAQLARQTSSIVVVPTLPAVAPANSPGWWLPGDPMAQVVASLFAGDRLALKASAAAAGYAGEPGELAGKFLLAGHSAGGGFATAVAAAYASSHVDATSLVGVMMYDGVSVGAFDGSGSFAGQIAALDARTIPLYQIAAPAQLWNAYGATTSALVAARPGKFNGVVLAGGSHVDALMGGDAVADFVAQRVAGQSSAANAAAIHTLGGGWINDLYAGFTPDMGEYGFYASANQPILMGSTAAVALPSPVANALSAGERRLDAEIDAIGGLTGFVPGPAVNVGTNGLSAAVAPARANGVTGVKTGTAALDIPCGETGFTTTADWYFPTQLDGAVAANGLVWLQRGEIHDAAAFAALATLIAGQTNSIVVVPAISAFEIPNLPGCFLGGAAMQQAVADMMRGSRGALAVSANAAGHQGALPEKILLAGERLGGGFAAEVGARTVDNGAAANLLGVVMVDGVASPSLFAASVAKLDSLGIPIYQIASPPQAANDWGRTTEQLAILHPDQFVGVQFDDGSPVDAVVTFATGWINDFYAGYGPNDPLYGLYASPNDGTYVSNQPIVLGGAGATVLPAPPEVDLNQYAGKWYEQGSVKQQPASGLVNVAAIHTPQPDHSLKVENSGTFGPSGPEWNRTGLAVSVNAFNTRLSVAYSGAPSTAEPGNYWILDYAPDYSWAIISDPTGTSGTILTRDQIISMDEYDALLARAYRLGVRRTITPTPQFPPV